jgi:trk system potassium uptake protein TrkA
VGSGGKALNLASRLEDHLIVDSDKRSIENLTNKGFNAVYCDLEDIESLKKLPLENSTVILASCDDVNLKVAEILKPVAKHIIALADSDDFCTKYEKAGVSRICRSSFAALVLSEVVETTRRYIEIEIDSDFENKTLKDVDIGAYCTIISILREGKFIRPHPDLRLKKGDIIGILCGKEVKHTKNPFDEILVVLRTPENVDSLMKEAKFLAKKFDSQLLILHKCNGALACSIHRGNKLENLDESEVIEALNSFAEQVDLVVVNPNKNRKEDEFLKKITEKFPVLISKQKTEYKRILVLVNTSTPDEILRLATSFSNYIGETKVLLLDQSLVSYSSKLTETKLEIEVSRGNPVIDAVKEAKSDYDLIIVSYRNDAGNIDMELLKRIIYDTPASVLVVD